MADLRIAVLTCAGPTADDVADDVCGRSLIEACEERGWLVVAYHVCQGDMESISTSLLEMTDLESADVVLTAGGIGLAPHEVAPEATARITERPLPGLAELVRRSAADSDAALAFQRGVAGIRGRSIVVNLPADPQAAMKAFRATADLFEEATAMIDSREVRS